MPLRIEYLLRNLGRNPLRTTLTCAAVAFPVAIFVLSVAVIDGIERFLDNSATQLRLAVTHKTSIVNPLPSGHRTRIESLDPSRQRLIAVCGMRFIGGRVEDDPRPLSTLAVDHDTFPAAFPEYLTDPAEREQWERDRRAIIVGSSTARQFHWKVGDIITIRPSLPPYTPMEFKVVSTAEGAADPVTNWCRLDYLRERLRSFGFAEDWISFIFIKCASPQDRDHFRAAIDQMFAGSPDETFTQDEKSFMNQFITQQFNLPRNLSILAAVTIFVAVMAAANTMNMNFRDRLSEFAALKALGFGGRLLCGLIQVESLLVCVLGGLIGALGPFIAFTYTPLRNLTVPLIQSLDVRPEVCARAILMAAGIGLLAALVPSWMALRLRVVTALRSLE
jgi:putative ABC transport system permease protein